MHEIKYIALIHRKSLCIKASVKYINADVIERTPDFQHYFKKSEHVYSEIAYSAEPRELDITVSIM